MYEFYFLIDNIELNVWELLVRIICKHKQLALHKKTFKNHSILYKKYKYTSNILHNGNEIYSYMYMS